MILGALFALVAVLVWLVALVAPLFGSGSGPAPAPGGAHHDTASTSGASNELPPSRPPPTATTLTEQGAYLARVGNCAGCHTARGGAPYAGGRALETPFGAVYAGNLTPDAETGLGRWSADDFWRALHDGRGRDGRRLVPVFPYESYARITRADSDAMYVWLRTLAPMRQANRSHDLRFPYGTQAALALWQWLYFRPGPVQDQALVQAQAQAAPNTLLARGDYLVNGLGHCGACHAPRGRLSAMGERLSGSEMPGAAWYAPALQPVAGDDTTAADLVELLRSGRNRHGGALGPMAGVVYNSTQFWSEADLRAAAEYLRSLPVLPPLDVPSSPPRAAAPQEVATTSELGRRLYIDRCADCHGDDGLGAPGAYPPLAGNPTVLQPRVHNLVQVIRHGSFAPATAANPRPYGMPPQELPLRETTAVINHLRQSWGNRAAPVNEVDVARVW
jgi:mono/diheme cytochrome c family protein